MPQLAEVIIYYGPYLANGVVTHRTHRLEGLQVLRGAINDEGQMAGEHRDRWLQKAS